MSKRRVSENLSYEVDNEGLEYDTDGNIIITANTFTVNAQPIVTGTVTGSNTINVGATPSRVLAMVAPKAVKLLKTNIAIAADTQTSIDWGSPTVVFDTFAIGPLMTGGIIYTAFVFHTGPGYFEFPQKGLWDVKVLLDIGAIATIDELTQVRLRFRSTLAGSLDVVAGATSKRTTGDTGDGACIGCSATVWCTPGSGATDQRLDVSIVSGQALVSGTAKYSITFTLLQPSPVV